MAAFVVIDVDIHDIGLYMRYLKAVRPLIDAAGARYLARGGEFRVLEGDYQPRRLVVMEFPSLAAVESFYDSEEFRALKVQRDACSQTRMVAVQGLPAAD